MHFFIFCNFVPCLFFLFAKLEASPYVERRMEVWGKDQEMTLDQKNEEELSSSKVCNAMIKFYQDKISPIDGPRSHFSPSSSEYARLAIKKYGPLKGIVAGCDRLLRENEERWIYPHHDGLKLDPIP